MPTGRFSRAALLLLPVPAAAVLLAGAAFPASPRAFQAVVLAAMLAALWSSGSRLARWLAPDLQAESRAVAAFTLAVGIAVVSATWLGHFGHLRPAPFLALTAAVLLLTRLVPLRKAVEAVEAASPGLAAEAAAESRRTRIDTALLLAAGLAIAYAGGDDMDRLRFAPAGAHGYDDISYHLSEVATWIRYGDLRMLRFSVGDPSTPFYPVLGELASWVLVAPFRDSDVAARWSQLPFALFAFLATAAIARRLGLSRRDSALAAIAYAGIHHVFPVLALTAGNDQSVAFLTLAGVDGALALARRPSAGKAVITGAALGLLLATKYIGILFAPVVLALLALAVWVERRAERRKAGGEGGEPAPAWKLLGLAALLAVVMAASGGYTYLRNAVTTGNPIFPEPVRLLGIELFPGWEGVSVADRARSPEARIEVLDFLTRRSRLFGSYFPFALLPAALAAPLLALWRRRWLAAAALSLPLVLFLEFLFLIGDHRDNRYFLPALALAAVALAWLLRHLGAWTFPLRALLLAWITIQTTRQVESTGLQKVVLALVLLGAGALLEAAARKWRGWQAGGASGHPPAWTARRGGLAAALALLLALGLIDLTAGRYVAAYQTRKLAHEPGPLALERVAGPGGARIAYAGMNQPYLFFGSRLQNDLEIVPRDWELAARYYSWRSELGDPYAVTFYRRWRTSLEDLGVTLVVIVRSPWEDPERRWIRRRPDDFSLEYEDPTVEIWRLVPPPPPPEETAGQG
jgi:hypothetical protein